MQLYTTSEEYKNTMDKLSGSNPSEVEKHVCGIILKDINRKKLEKNIGTKYSKPFWVNGEKGCVHRFDKK